MSAIFGILNKKRKPIDPATILNISTVLAHRAPDGLGIWQDEHVVIGHCKLAMNHAEQLQSMPLITDDLVITADIRIDNKSYLLQQTGAPKDATDITLLWYAWLKWKEQCVKHLEGEYVICIWDIVAQKCFIATDHIGFRALYYYDAPDVFIFCSEQKGIQAIKPSPHLFNEVSLIEYYFRQASPAATYDADIHMLCGGNTLQLTLNNISIRKYWTPEGGKYTFRKDEDWQQCLKELIYGAASNRLNTDKSTGITLSGGLDSSALTCILSELLLKKNKPLYAFSAVLPDDHHLDEEDERRYIDIIGRHCPNLIQTYVTAAEYSPFDNIMQAFEQDETFPNVFHYMDQAILSAAAEKRTGVLFTGYGGDHWISWKGNPVIHQMIRKGRIISAFKLMKAFSEREGKSLKKIFQREYIKHALKKKKQAIAEAPYLQEPFFKKHQEGISFSRVEDITSFMYNNLLSGRTGILPAMLAKRNERYGMQSAVPLLDKRVMEFMIDVPQQLFVSGGWKRSLIRHAMRGVVPPEVLWRSDKGMYAPDYISRVVKEQAFIREVCQSDKYAIAFKHYLSEDGLTTDYTHRKDTGFIRTTQAVIVSTILSELQQKGYVIPS